MDVPLGPRPSWLGDTSILQRLVQSHDDLALAASIRALSTGGVYLYFQLSLRSARAAVTYVRSATSRRPDLAFTPALNQC